MRDLLYDGRAVRRGVVVGGLIVALAAAVWLWWGHDAPTATSESQARGLDHASFKTFDPKDPLAKLRWLGQRGVAPRRVAGTVLMDDRPVAGATVVLGSAHATAGLIAAPHVVSDASGHFDFGSQIATSYVVSADMPHRAGAVVAADVRDPTQRTDQLELVLHACDATVVGTIRDAGGPIAKARVTRLLDDIVSGSTAVADDGGNYELCMPVGSNDIVASADGYAQKSASVTTYGQLRRDFSLVPEAIVSGHVVAAADHTPVAGAIITLRSEEWITDARGHLTTVSDETGRFSFTGVTPGRNQVSATTDHARTLQPVHVIAAMPPTSEDVICEVAVLRSVSGIVTDHKNGVAGLSLRLTKQVTHDGPPGNAVTQADGSFVLEGVEAGDYTMTIQNHPLKGDAGKVHVGKSDVEGLVLEVERFGSISGRITHDGKPVEGADVRASGAQTTSDANGHYELHDLEHGTHQIYAESRRIGSFASGPSVALDSGETKTGVDIELDLSGSIAGIIVDQDDAPVGGATLDFSLLHGSDTGSATTADNGSFTVNALSGGGSYGYVVHGPTKAMYPTVDGKRLHPIEVRDAHTHVTGVRIRVRVDRLTIAGRVIDATGRPAPDVVVIASPQRALRSSATTDANGGFEIRDLATGQYDLRTNALGGNGKNQTVEAGRTDIVIQLGEAGGIEGTLDRFATPPLVWAFTVDGWFTATVTGKTFRVRDVPAGDYEIRATSSDAQGSAKVTVAAGRTANVSVQGTGLGSIAGTVLGPNGRGLPDLFCTESGNYQDQRTDANGELRFDHMPAGAVTITCWGPAIMAQANTTVSANDVAHVTLMAKPIEPEPRGKSGLVLENQIGNVAVIKSVAVGGPGERAGIAVDDIVLQVDGRPIAGAYDASDSIEGHPSGTVVKLTLERADKQLTVNLTLD
jgi:Carboxypeptidase regulatory-like domain/PDZ domain